MNKNETANSITRIIALHETVRQGYADLATTVHAVSADIDKLCRELLGEDYERDSGISKTTK